MENAPAGVWWCWPALAAVRRNRVQRWWLSPAGAWQGAGKEGVRREGAKPRAVHAPHGELPGIQAEFIPMPDKPEVIFPFPVP